MILGVDTHRDTHVAAVISLTGKTLAVQSFAAIALAYRQLVQWTPQLGVVQRAGAEGSGSYGAALSRYLLSRGIDVIEVPGPGRSARRRRSKSDQSDAQAAACAVLSGRASSRVKAGNGPVEIARMYNVARNSAVKACRQAANQLKAVLVTCVVNSAGHHSLRTDAPVDPRPGGEIPRNERVRRGVLSE
ncbi:transposase [Streptomyces sp. NPDC059928]|uniref:IS110 family transposase n=1 Tax=unclassified Streptomyces TaxID=2593676 RepID=UPI0036646F35